MNKHVNKNKPKKPWPQNLGVVTEMPDNMPKEVAESLLLTPGTRLTNRMRKNCHAARVEDIFCSTLEPKDPLKKLTAKLKLASAAQLAKWSVRTFQRRLSVNRTIKKFDAKLVKLPETAKSSRMIVEAVLRNCNEQAIQCDTMMAALRAEAESRLNNERATTGKP